MNEPVHSVLLDGRLVAYIYFDGDCGVFRAGSDHRVAELNDGRIETYAREQEPLIRSLAEREPVLEGLLFRLQIEGFEVRAGRLQPSGALRRF